MKRLLLLIILVVSLAIISAAQDSESEATAESTAEVTAEATAAPDTTPEAQATEDPECPALVSTALDLTQDRCEDLGIGQACYGYTLAESESRTEEAVFNQPGDIIDLLDIQTLQLSAMDTTTGQWGVVEFKVEANLPENPSSSAQDIQFVVFGDTELSDSGQFVKATAEETTSIRYLPESGSEIIGELETGDTAVASARLIGNEWVRIPVVLEDGSPILGWIPVENLTFDIDINILPEVTAEEAADTSTSELNTRFGPMQQFVFQSGVDDAPCSAAPDSGMLIQTPEGQASVTIVMDEVVVQLSGTVVVSGEAGSDLQLDLIDGEAQVTADGETRTAVEGQSVTVPLGENGLASGAPNDPVPLDLDNPDALPLDLLDDNVEIATPLDLPPGVPISGEWSLEFNVSTLECSDGTDWPVAAVGTVSIEAQQDALLYAGNLHSEVGTGIYQGSYTVSNGDSYTNVLQVGATDRITGTTDIDFAQGNCTLTAPFTLQLVNAN